MMSLLRRAWRCTRESGIQTLAYFYFWCLSVCMYIGFNVHNSLLSVVLGLRARLHPYYEHLLALVRYEKGSPSKSLPLQPHGLSQLWRREVHHVGPVYAKGDADYVKLVSIPFLLQEMLCWTTVLAAALEDDSSFEEKTFSLVQDLVFFLFFCNDV